MNSLTGFTIKKMKPVIYSQVRQNHLLLHAWVAERAITCWAGPCIGRCVSGLNTGISTADKKTAAIILLLFALIFRKL